MKNNWSIGIRNLAMLALLALAILAVLVFDAGGVRNITKRGYTLNSEVKLSTGNAVTGVAIESGDLAGLEVSIDVPEKYQKVIAGADLQFEVQIKNIKQAGRQDLQLDYSITKNDILVGKRRELKAVETQASFLSSINVPEETLPGIYNLQVAIEDEESASATFYVKSSEANQIRNYILLLVGVIIAIGVLISWELYRLRKVESRLTKRK
jgi:hypothetical protein